MFILDWLRVGVSWILVQFHQLLSTFMDPASGWTWTLSIVGLVLTIRILLIPLFVKQINSQRNMQLIQPQIKEIQEKYKGDKERQSQEMMKLYRETGTNPLASCLPIIAQMPIFFALFNVLNGIAHDTPEGVFAWPQYEGLLQQAHDASIFGVPLYGTFMGADAVAADGFSPMNTRILAMVLVVLMTATTFISQRQLIVKNTAADNPIVKQQKMMLYVFPLIFAISGVNFPVGVLIYWFVTNLWSMGQQFWVIRNNPQPGTPAHAAKEERMAAKAARKAGQPILSDEASEQTEEPTQRVQPKRTSRSKRKRS